MTYAQSDPTMNPDDEENEHHAHHNRVERRRDTVDWDENDDQVESLLAGEFHDGESTS